MGICKMMSNNATTNPMFPILQSIIYIPKKIKLAISPSVKKAAKDEEEAEMPFSPETLILQALFLQLFSNL